MCGGEKGVERETERGGGKDDETRRRGRQREEEKEEEEDRRRIECWVQEVMEKERGGETKRRKMKDVKEEWNKRGRRV